MTRINKYRSDPEYREKTKKMSNSYYQRNKEKIIQKQREMRESGIGPKRSYKKNLVSYLFFGIGEYRDFLIGHILSGTTEKLIDIYYVDTITYRKLYTYLNSYKQTRNKEQMREEYREILSGFSEEKQILVLMKE